MSVLLLPMCDQMEGPLPAGTVQATDSKADALMRQAIAYRDAGKTGKYESKLEEIIASHSLAPCAPKARFMLGESLERRGEYRDAFKQYSKIIERYQDSDLYPQALNRQLAMATGAVNGKIKGKVLWYWDVKMESSVVIEWLESVIRNAPYGDMAATACSVLGDYLYKEKSYAEAIEVYHRLVELYPDSAYAPTAQMMVANLLASSHTRGNQDRVYLARAREAYEEFTLLFPDHADVDKARAGVQQVEKLLVQQELEVGRYYLDRAHENEAAIFCLENVIRKKEINPEAAAEATKLLAQARSKVEAAKAKSKKSKQ